jgi:phosphoglycolate phosphatase-like HAD superfamily hydrolase
MILEAAQRLGLDLTASVGIGDRWRDVEAARRAGVRSVFVDRHYSERRPEQPDATVASLPDAVTVIETHRNLWSATT